MMGAAFELGDLKDAQDPYALYRVARKAGAVQRRAGSWIIFGHGEGADLLRNGETRSGFIADGYRKRLPAGAARDEMAHRINFLDPPRHGQVRRLIGKVFTPRRTSRLQPFVEGITKRLLERLPNEQPIDLIPTYAHEVPSLVISELLGVPVAHRDRLTILSEQVSRLLGTGVDDKELSRALSAAEEMHATLRSVHEERLREPQDDLLSALLAAEGDEKGDRLTESELLSLAATLYSAGHRTTRDLFSNGLTALLPDRDLVAARREGSLPIGAIVEEFLRFETPTHFVARMLQTPMDLGGQRIPANEPIAVLLAAANRDPEFYPEAERFDPWRWTRTPAQPPPLSFALGAHFCIGASLARLEVSIMLDMLFEIYPDVRLADTTLRWHHTGVFRGLEKLPVILGPRA
jgi:pimeloyl-[acyl-carrier protein] synthase